ncbi:acetyl-CoA C-acetyltransferase [Niveispirillum fermenti]|uniref:acetyl-CoA C-acetyltransferase n=1 Tax=Niveispirillum fermenti TaxID=1233113 RepID=UPI003A89A4E0
MPEAYIFDAVRTPRGRGKPDGSLHHITPLSLSAQVLAALRDRNGLDTSFVDDVVLGCVSPVGDQGADIARTAVLMADYAESVSGIQVHRYCASGLDAVNIAAAKVMAGEARLAIGGGVESMSRIPINSDGGAWPIDPDSALKNYFVPQGISADLIATLDGFSRTDVDAYAVESQRRAARAWQEGRFARSIVPVRDQAGNIALSHDEHMRPDASIGGLAGLKPAFQVPGEAAFDAIAIQRYPQVEQIEHVHHAGNSSGIVDGASGVLIGTKEAGAALGLKPRARIRGGASIGSEPTIMLTAPATVSRKLLHRLGMVPGDIDLYELNEAFAAVVLRMMAALSIPHDKMNVNGGAIAMGHPLGATGAMILGTVLDELERTGKGTALITLCAGAGQGAATLIERV